MNLLDVFLIFVENGDVIFSIRCLRYVGLSENPVLRSVAMDFCFYESDFRKFDFVVRDGNVPR